jgi:hypothetical protein
MQPSKNKSKQKQFYTYLHCKPNGDPFYVGKGGAHRGNRYHLFNDGRNAHYKNIISKYGTENIEVLVFPAPSEEQAFADERTLIKFYGRQDLGTGCLVNMTDGGEGASGSIKSKETCAKLSAANKDRKHTAQSRLNMSAAHIGKNCGSEHGMFGKHHSPETCAKIKAKRALQIITPETCAKLSVAGKGRVSSEETKHKIAVSVAESWKIRHANGESRSTESRGRSSISLKKSWAKRKGVGSAV